MTFKKQFRNICLIIIMSIPVSLMVELLNVSNISIEKVYSDIIAYMEIDDNDTDSHILVAQMILLVIKNKLDRGVDYYNHQRLSEVLNFLSTKH